MRFSRALFVICFSAGLMALFAVLILPTGGASAGTSHAPTAPMGPAAGECPNTNQYMSTYSTNTWLNGQPVPVGAVITATDPDGIQIGVFTVTSGIGAGNYGTMYLCGDDATTSGVDEGAVDGDPVHFFINGVPSAPGGPDAATWSNLALRNIDLFAPGHLIPKTLKEYTPSGSDTDKLSTAVQVQNLDTGNSTNITLTYYDVTGTKVTSVTQTANAGQSVGIDQRFPSGGLTGIASLQGGGVLLSNRNVALIVNEMAAQGTGSIGKSYRMDSFSGIVMSDTAKSVSAPQVLKNIFDSGQQKTWNSLIAIQNSTPFTATGIATFYPMAGGAPVPIGFSVPGWATKYLNLTNESSLGTNFFGSATITATQPIAVIINQLADGGLLAYKGFTSGSQTVYAPQLLKDIYDSQQQLTWGSAIQAMAVSGSATVCLTYFPSSGGSLGPYCQTASPAASFDQRFDSNLSGSFFGSGIITGTSNIMVITNMQTDYSPTKGARLMTYRGFPEGSGATTLQAPQMLKNIYDSGQQVTWGTAIAAQSLGGTGQVCITYTPSGGGSPVGPTCTTANPQATFDQRFDAALGSSFFGSATITSTVPIVGKVNLTGASADVGDAASNYTLVSP